MAMERKTIILQAKECRFARTLSSHVIEFAVEVGGREEQANEELRLRQKLTCWNRLSRGKSISRFSQNPQSILPHRQGSPLSNTQSFKMLSQLSRATVS